MIFTKKKKDISADSNKPQSLFERLKNKALDIWEYCSKGVWEDKRDTLKIRIVKTLNLTIRTFMSADLQSKACAMTYRTLLAIVPALALLFAIGRGFGFQNLLQNQVYQYLPSQRKALEMAFSFVDSCLAQASEGIFVGVGIVFLLWTLISLLDSVEESFNNIWGITADRPLARKVTDYLAIFIILPVLMICSSGLQIFMSTTIQKLLPFADITPFLGDLLDLASVALSWLFFAGAYMLIPNTKVRFQNALIAGVLAGTAFQILQWLFVTGQVYVAKYNADLRQFFFPSPYADMDAAFMADHTGRSARLLLVTEHQHVFFRKTDRFHIFRLSPQGVNRHAFCDSKTLLQTGKALQYFGAIGSIPYSSETLWSGCQQTY